MDTENHCFVSYAGSDGAEARVLADGLTAAGLAVYCTARDGQIALGAGFVRELEEGIARSRAFALLVGARGVDRWVRLEVDAALARAAAEPGYRLVPVLLPGVVLESLPPFVRTRHAFAPSAPPSQWSSAEWERLARDLRGEFGVAERPPCPYPGLQFFSEGDAPHFFGRAAEVQDLRARLGDTPAGYRRWLQIEGPSGSGKSSLARAGLLPALRRDLTEAAFAVLRPGRRPTDNLAEAIWAALDRPATPLELDWVLEKFRDPDGLRLLVRPRPVVLLVDQLEELFTLAREGEPAQAELEHFDALLDQALGDTDRPFFLLTTIRSDFTGDLVRLPRLAARLNAASRYYLRPPGPEGLREAVLGPAGAVGLSVEPGLVEVLVRETTEQGSSLPLLGHALRALYDRAPAATLRMVDHSEQGGVAGALARSADALLDRLGPERREPARRLLLNLVRTGRGTEDTRRPAPRADVLEAAGGGAAADRLLARLSGGRDPEAPEGAPPPVRLVVVSGQDEGQARVDLVHEALLDRWPTLKAWVEQDRRLLERRDDAEVASATWEVAGAAEDGLPSGALLAHLRGEGLASAERERYASLLDPRTRAFVDRAAAEERERQGRKIRAARLLRVAFVVAVVLSVAAAGAAWWALDRSHEAGAQRDLASQRLREARKVAEYIVFTIDRRLVDVAGAAGVRRDLLEQSAKLLDWLAVTANEEDSPGLLHGRISAHVQRGELAFSHDDLAVALREYQSAFDAAQKLVDLDPSSVEWQRDLGTSLGRLGDLHTARGELDAALAAFERSLKISEALASQDPSNAGLRRDLSVSLIELGDLQTARGNLAAALAAFERSLEIVEALASQDPSIAGRQRDLSASLERLGGLHTTRGDLDAALAALERELKIREALARQDPSNAEWQRDLSVSLNKLGDLHTTRGDLAAALAPVEHSLKIREALARQDPSNARWQRDLGVSLERLGDLHTARGELDAALAAFERSLKIAEALARQDPSNAGWQRDLAVSREWLGFVHEKRGDAQAAIQWRRQAVLDHRALAEGFPTNSEFLRSQLVAQLHFVRLLSGLAEPPVPEIKDLLSSCGRILDGFDASGAYSGEPEMQKVRGVFTALKAALVEEAPDGLE